MSKNQRPLRRLERLALAKQRNTERSADQDREKKREHEVLKVTELERRLDLEEMQGKHARLHEAAVALAEMYSTSASLAKQSANIARRWVVTSAVAADLAGIWVCFANDKLPLVARKSAAILFVFGVVIGFIGGLWEQGVKSSDADVAEKMYADAIVAFGRDQPENFRPVEEKVLSARSLAKFALVVLDFAPIAMFVSGAQVLLDVLNP